MSPEAEQVSPKDLHDPLVWREQRPDERDGNLAGTFR